MTDLREALSKIMRPRRLFESVWDDVANKWKKVPEGQEVPADSDIEMYIDSFKTLKLRQVIRGAQADISEWGKRSFAEFKTFVDTEQSKVAQVVQKKEKEKREARRVFENDKVVVVQPFTFEASQKYGKGTKWCITGYEHSGDVHWKNYTSSGGVFYFVISKHYYFDPGDDPKKSDPLSKVAFHVLPHNTDNPQQIAAYDAQDKPLSKDYAEKFLKDEGIPTNLIQNRLTFDDAWLSAKFGPAGWSRNAQGLVDIDGTLNLRGLELGSIPIKFGKVKGNCDLSSTQLTRLSGAPQEVTGNFLCVGNKLTSLEGGPVRVGGNYDASSNPGLVSLTGAPETLGGALLLMGSKLKSLEGCPRQVQSLDVSGCGLKSLKGGPEKVFRMFLVSRNALTSLEGAPLEVGDVFSIYNNQLTSMVGCPQKVKSIFASMNEIATLEGVPAYVPGEFDFGYNSLTSLKGAPRIVGNMSVVHNDLTTLAGGPEQVTGDFDVSNNKLASLVGSPKVAGEFTARNNKITSNEGLPAGQKVNLQGNPVTGSLLRKPRQSAEKKAESTEQVINNLLG